MNLPSAHEAVAYIKRHLPENFQPKLALTLGSGLGATANIIDEVACLAYADIPGFHASSVAGHPGKLIFGYAYGLPIVCLQGRAHFYEGASSHTMRNMIRSLKLLGCEMLILTNASASLREDTGPGSLMLISDHINFQGINPLVGPNEETFGLRFPPMNNAYDADIRTRFKQLAAKNHIALNEGVYCGVLGPNYETPAEIRAFRILGADAVGMSTVPEVILARHCGLRVACVATITNYGAGMRDDTLSHEDVVTQAAAVANKVVLLLQLFIQSLQDAPL